MLIAAIALGGIGLLCAVGLGVAAKIFFVQVDPVVQAVEEALPGANCGGCGYAGCSSAAVAMVKGEMAPNNCVASGPAEVAAVAAILGVEIVESEPEKAQVGCRYPVAQSDLKYLYSGATDCRAAVLMSGGPKECPVGCIGLGSCVQACPFDALSIGPDGLPQVDEVKCTGCGTCVRVCPMGIMRLTSCSDRILGEQRLDDCTAPCQRTCPAGINIPEQIHYTAQGDYAKALLAIKERNPLPLICGRICPRPCEDECRRNLADEPVAINYLKRFVADHEWRTGQRLPLFKAPETGRRVAVVGGGVEGMTAAHYLARLGHAPVIYEAAAKLGGLLRTAIPESRLPRDVLDYEIEGLLEVGVEAKTGQKFGQDFNLSDLFGQGFETVLLATGGWDTLLLSNSLASGAPAMPNLYLLLPLTVAWAAGQEVKLEGEVAVIGGGKNGLDAALKIKAGGAGRVTFLVRREKEQSGLTAEARAEAGRAGVRVEFGVRVDKLTGRGDDLTGVEYTIAGQQAHLPAGTVVASAGRLPDMLIVPTSPLDGEGPVEWETALPYHDPAVSPRSLFDGVEPTRDFMAAVEAIGAGRRAAASIHQWLTTGSIEPPARMITDPSKILTVYSVHDLPEAPPRQAMPLASAEARLDPTAEVELGFDEQAARQEAQRCLKCGLICYQRTRYNDRPLESAVA